MMSLFDKLNEIDKNISSFQSAEFGICLLTFLAHWQSDSDSHNLSPNELLKKAEDDGYDCTSFTSILRQISSYELGTASTTSLISYIQSIADNPNGVNLLSEHIADHFPKLEMKLMDFGAIAAEENKDLSETAGGKGIGEIAGISTGGLALIGLGAVGIHKWRKASAKKKTFLAQKAEADSQAAKEAANKAYNKEINSILEDAFTPLDFKEGQIVENATKDYDDLMEHQELFAKISNDFDFKAYARDAAMKGERSLAFGERELELKVAKKIRVGGLKDLNDLSDVERKLYETAKKNETIGISFEQKLVEDPRFKDWAKGKIVTDKYYETFANKFGSIKSDAEINDILEQLHNDHPKFVRNKLVKEEGVLETDVKNEAEKAVDKAKTDLLETAKVEEKTLESDVVGATDKAAQKAENELLSSIGSLEDAAKNAAGDIESV
ncbi:hypothetical protein ACLM45_03305 [Synechococcus sp. A10-1-5-9]|uniref:hypothetical protein n=1 Tax=Synechococcus sp. A10-1-5-9 TaxID=3392295 RepID=UPI0039EA655B